MNIKQARIQAELLSEALQEIADKPSRENLDCAYYHLSQVAQYIRENEPVDLTVKGQGVVMKNREQRARELEEREKLSTGCVA